MKQSKCQKEFEKWWISLRLLFPLPKINLYANGKTIFKDMTYIDDNVEFAYQAFSAAWIASKAYHKKVKKNGVK